MAYTYIISALPLLPRRSGGLEDEEELRMYEQHCSSPSLPRATKAQVIEQTHGQGRGPLNGSFTRGPLEEEKRGGCSSSTNLNYGISRD